MAYCHSGAAALAAEEFLPSVLAPVPQGPSLGSIGWAGAGGENWGEAEAAWENLTCPSPASLLDIKLWIEMQMHSKKRDIWSELKQQVAFSFLILKAT